MVHGYAPQTRILRKQTEREERWVHLELPFPVSIPLQVLTS